jgi:hypothetical protein
MSTEQEPQLKFDWRSITPEDSPKTPLDTMKDPALRDLSTPKLSVGDPAFDIELPAYDFSDGSERLTGETFHLSAIARDRPVALIFGSYT